LYRILETLNPKYAPNTWTKIVSPASTAPIKSFPINSLTLKMTISITVMRISCIGEVIPSTTPNDIRTEAVAKSAESIVSTFTSI